MPFEKMKVYFDGSHYIGIAHKEKPKRRVCEEQDFDAEENEIEEKIKYIVDPETGEAILLEEVKTDIPVFEDVFEEDYEQEHIKEAKEQSDNINYTKEFEKLYKQSLGLKPSDRKAYIRKGLKQHINREELLDKYLEENMMRKLRNKIARNVRLTRKLNLLKPNYFVTFTYDSGKMAEEEFKNKLKKCLNNFATRKNWRYIGAWEHSLEKKRLHFHGIFLIPDGTMPGELYETSVYSFKMKQRKKVVLNTFFEKRFGRADFELIEDQFMKGHAIAYLLKYVEKTGEKLVFSRGLAQYIESDVLEDDVLCRYYSEMDTKYNVEKYILADDFSCYKDGEFIGRVNETNLADLPTLT